MEINGNFQYLILRDYKATESSLVFSNKHSLQIHTSNMKTKKLEKQKNSLPILVHSQSKDITTSTKMLKSVALASLNTDSFAMYAYFFLKQRTS